MIQSDNMGGFISAGFILQDEISLFVPFANKCKVLLKSLRKWKLLDIKHEGVTVSINTEESDAGDLYIIKGSVVIKKESQFLDILKRKKRIVLRVQTPDKFYRVLGTDEYPLKSSLKPLTPNKPTGFNGYELVFEGKQLIEPPFLDI